MYHRGEKLNEIRDVPFRIECTNCGSHDVNVVAFDHLDLEIKCRRCNSYLDVGKYNETTYKEGF